MLAVEQEPEQKTPVVPPPFTVASERKTPPQGRPVGALTISEMVVRITADVRKSSAVELEAHYAKLHAELRAEQKLATNLFIAGLTLNGVAVVTMFAFARWIPGLVVGLALAGMCGCGFAIARAGWSPTRRRGQVLGLGLSSPRDR